MGSNVKKGSSIRFVCGVEIYELKSHAKEKSDAMITTKFAQSCWVRGNVFRDVLSDLETFENYGA